MEQEKTPTGPVRRRRTGQVVGAVVLTLFVIGGFANGPGTGLAVLGLVALVAGGWAAVRGKASWVHLATRRAGLVVGVAGLAAFVVGAAVSPAPRTSAASASGSVSSSSGPATPSSTSTASVEASPPSISVPTVGAVPLTAVTPTSTPSPTLPPAPTMALTCPSGGSVASPSFGERISATGPYTVDVDYGDGEHYRNDDKHLAAVFSHTYRVSGNFTVSALLTDGAGQTTSASCVYRWVKPAPAPSPRTGTSVGSGSTAGSGPTSRTTSGSGSTSGGDTYTNVDGNQVHVPVQAPSAPAGATAHCRDGSWSFSQHRSGTCSGHGGVAEWL